MKPIETKHDELTAYAKSIATVAHEGLDGAG